MKDLQQALNERMKEIISDERAKNENKGFQVVRNHIDYDFMSGKWVLVLELQNTSDYNHIKPYKTVTL